jgi:hypothetical protein
MAHDIFSGETKRSWSRDQETSSASGYDPYARSLFDRRVCAEPPPVIVQKEPARIGWLGATLAVMFSTRILSGKWPWYWAGLAGKKLEGHSAPRRE